MTQLNRPTITEAAHEATISNDSHWTSNLSTIGMTRISSRLVRRTWLDGYRAETVAFLQSIGA